MPGDDEDWPLGFQIEGMRRRREREQSYDHGIERLQPARYVEIHTSFHRSNEIYPFSLGRHAILTDYNDGLVIRIEGPGSPTLMITWDEIRQYGTLIGPDGHPVSRPQGQCWLCGSTGFGCTEAGECKNPNFGPRDGARCRRCGWTYYEATCPCRLPKEERIAKANAASVPRDPPSRFDRDPPV